MTDGKNWDNTGHRFNGGLLLPVIDKIKLNLSGEAFLQDYNYQHGIWRQENGQDLFRIGRSDLGNA